jgi:ABC-type branched-subunit amino acid transport system substrate-binding protein
MAAGIAVAGCSGTSRPPGPAAPFRIGATVDLSGPLAAYGRAFSAAWHAYFDTLDAHGGVRGQPVELEILDDGGVPARQTANFRAFEGRGALLVSGITLSDTCALLAASAAAAHLPELCTTIPAALAVAPPPYVYSMSDPETMWVRAVVRVIDQQVHMAAPRVATILPEAAGLQDMGDAFEATAAARGWTVVATQSVPLEHLTDVSGPVATVLAAHPDAVLTDIASVGAVPMVRQLRAGGFTGPIIMGNADYATMAALRDPQLYQIWPTALVDPSSSLPSVQTMVHALADQGVTGTSAVNSLAIPLEYLGATLVARALGSCVSPCTPSRLDAALKTSGVNVPGLSVGTFGYSPGRNVPSTQVDVVAWDARAGAPRPWATRVPAVQPFVVAP